MRVCLAIALTCAAAFAANPANPRASGSPNAPIAIVLFSDYQCPACKTLHDRTLQPLMRDYVRTGKVYLVHHEFPLPQHKYALQAAYYACAAARMGKYEEVGNLLFRTQYTWGMNGKIEEMIASVLSPAEMATLRKYAKDPAIAAEVQRDIELGRRMQLRETPWMIFKGRGAEYPLAGAVNYDLLRSLLDRTLAK
jgi:protein-disulfide isomerase